MSFQEHAKALRNTGLRTLYPRGGRLPSQWFNRFAVLASPRDRHEDVEIGPPLFGAGGPIFFSVVDLPITFYTARLPLDKPR